MFCIYLKKLIDTSNRKNSMKFFQHFTFPTSNLTAFSQNGSHVSIKFCTNFNPHNDNMKKFSNCCKFLKRNPMYIRVHSLSPILLMQLQQQLQTRLCGDGATSLVLYSALQHLSSSSRLDGNFGAQPFPDLSRDVKAGPVWALAGPLQGPSQSCPEATPVISWRCARGCCSADR